MKILLKKLQKKTGTCSLLLGVWATQSFGGLIKPPDASIASGSNDWVDTTDSLLVKFANYMVPLLAIVIILGVGASIFKSFRVAQEKQDVGHFFSTLGCGVLCIALSLGMLWAAHLILPSGRGA